MEEKEKKEENEEENSTTWEDYYQAVPAETLILTWEQTDGPTDQKRSRRNRHTPE